MTADRHARIRQSESSGQRRPGRPLNAGISPRIIPGIFRAPFRTKTLFPRSRVSPSEANGVTNMLVTILMVFALVLLVLASAGVNPPRVNLGWAGLACWSLAVLLAGVHIGALN